MITPTATQRLLEDEAERQKLYALKALMLRLEHWARAIPYADGVDMPDHSIHFMTEIDDGPGVAIDDAIRGCPELWLDALPSDVVIVPRASAEQLGVSRDVLDYLASMGRHMVEVCAYRHSQKVEADRKHRGKR